MKKILIMLILILMAISCSYFELGDELIREKGYKCFYNHKGERLGCRYIR